MRFHVLTLFPEMVRQGLNTSIIGRAVQKNCIEIETVNIRDYSADKNGRVDDYTYGGGAGMLMQAQPVYDAWKAVAERIQTPRTDGGQNSLKTSRPRTIYVTPQGSPFTQKMAAEFSGEEDLIFLCGHYEGIDERVLEEIVTDHVSIGDYVLTGGELPAMVMIDAIARLVPGVLHNEASAQSESFCRDLLEYPQYSRPEEWHGKRVPEVLLSGNHSKIAAWRLEQSKRRTACVRPDLYERYSEREALVRKLSQNKRHNIHMMERLLKGSAEIWYNAGENVLLYDPDGDFYMVKGEPGSGADEMLALIPEDARLIVTSQDFLNAPLCAALGEMDIMECKQACYTQKNVLPVRHKDIRGLSAEHLAYVAEHYAYEDAEYLRGRIAAGALYGAFVEERPVGFMGWHAEGALGLLYVEPEYRRRGIGTALEAFCINLCLGQGRVPYGHIAADNAVSLKMQEHMGLYLSAESLWWLEKKSR